MESEKIANNRIITVFDLHFQHIASAPNCTCHIHFCCLRRKLIRAIGQKHFQTLTTNIRY